MKEKDPPDYPGDEVVKKAMDDALRKLFREKDVSLEEAYAALKKANQKDPKSMVPRALGIVVRQFREKKRMPRAQLSRASGLSVRFIGVVDVAPIAFGLNRRISDFVSQVDEVSRKLEGK